MDESQRNPNRPLLAVIAVLAIVNTVLITSDLRGAVRYSLGAICVVGLVVCVFMISRNISRKSDVDS